MHEVQKKRASKRLLVAALGVATVSYMGCAADSDGTEEDYGSESLAEEAQPTNTAPASAEQSVDKAARINSDSDPQTTLGIQRLPEKFPPSGNLMAPPPPPTGNLMVPPPSGNLMAPPVLGPRVLTPSIPIPPPSGNLMAPPIRELEQLDQLEQIELAR